MHQCLVCRCEGSMCALVEKYGTQSYACKVIFCVCLQRLRNEKVNSKLIMQKVTTEVRTRHTKIGLMYTHIWHYIGLIYSQQWQHRANCAKLNYICIFFYCTSYRFYIASRPASSKIKIFFFKISTLERCFDLFISMDSFFRIFHSPIFLSKFKIIHI